MLQVVIVFLQRRRRVFHRLPSGNLLHSPFFHACAVKSTEESVGDVE
jgi:hypothetical protein